MSASTETRPGRILLADDEETFLEATAALLRRAGYACDTARDATEAAGFLGAAEYDVLIADIRMPGNSELDLLRHTAVTHRSTPVILVTGYPTLDTAIRSVELSVVAYMVKPLAFDQLEVRVRAVINGSRAARAVREARERLGTWQRDVARATDALEVSPRQIQPASFELFLTTTSQTILDSLADLRHVTEALAGGGGAPEPCHLLNCPRLRQYKDAVVAAIAVLEETKGAFKSRQLGELRQNLEALVKEMS
jgi:DNA-binding response OmpR family regulator